MNIIRAFTEPFKELNEPIKEGETDHDNALPSSNVNN